MKTELQNNDSLLTAVDQKVVELEYAVINLFEQKRALRETHRLESIALDRRIYQFLWSCRGVFTTQKIAKMVGLSRQRLYEKWKQYGYNPDDE